MLVTGLGFRDCGLIAESLLEITCSNLPPGMLRFGLTIGIGFFFCELPVYERLPCARLGARLLIEPESNEMLDFIPMDAFAA